MYIQHLYICTSDEHQGIEGCNHVRMYVCKSCTTFQQGTWEVDWIHSFRGRIPAMVRTGPNLKSANQLIPCIRKYPI